MHILIAAQAWAHPGHDLQSANLVNFEFARVFREFGWRVTFVCTYWNDRIPSADIEAGARAALAQIGVDVEEPIVLNRPSSHPGRLASLIGSNTSIFFPEASFRELANERVRKLRPDVVFVPWSEMATQLFADAPGLRVAYYGNPDPKNWRLNGLPPVAPSRGAVRDMLARLRLDNLERIHLREMKKYNLFGDVALNDVEYYRSHGLPDAFYSRMVYLDRFQGAWEEPRDRLEPGDKTIVVANIGSQAATGNMLAMDYLADRVAEPMKRAFAGARYEIHLYGGGKLRPDIKEKLSRPEIKNHGFVQDIDGAILGSQVFLCLNNATAYKVNQSRYLHAWSLGACVVAHRDAALSLPEMVHDENALLGDSADEIAELVVQAADDKALRRRLGRAGYETYAGQFTAKSVVADLVARMQSALDRRDSLAHADK